MRSFAWNSTIVKNYISQNDIHMEVASLTDDVPWLQGFFVLLLSGYLFSVASVQLLGPKAPLVGIRSFLEPRLIGNWRFFKDSGKIIEEGYSRV